MGTGDGERAGSQTGAANRSSAGGGTLRMGEQAGGGAGGWRRRPLRVVCRGRGELRESSRGSVLRVAGRWQCLCRCGLLYRHRRGAELASEQGQRSFLSASQPKILATSNREPEPRWPSPTNQTINRVSSGQAECGHRLCPFRLVPQAAAVLAFAPEPF